MVRAGSKLKTIASKLIEVRHRLPDRTEIVLALPQPNEYFGSLLTVSTTDPELVEIEMALFVHHLPALSDVIRAHQAAGTRAATGYFLELLPNGDMHVLWFDQQSLKRQETTLLLRISEG